MKHIFLSAKQFGRSVRKAVYLYKNIWKECSTVLLHASREVNKTDRALDIAIDLSISGHKVLYVNVDGNLGAYSDIVSEFDNISVFNPEFASPDDCTDYAELIFDAIEQAVATTSIRTFVIDSVTRIAALSFGRNASASYIMKRLIAIQNKCKVSILAVAHDLNRSTTRSLVALADSEIDVSSEKLADVAVSHKSAEGIKTESKSVEDNQVAVVDPTPLSELVPTKRATQKNVSDRLSLACQRNAAMKQVHNRNKRKLRSRVC